MSTRQNFGMRLIEQRRRRASGAGNSAPNQPTISAGSLTSSGATLTGSAFSDPDVGDTHAASQWQVTASADTGYASPVISTGDDATNKTSYAATGLSASTDYIARVRYKDSAGNYSAWATSANFTTAAGGFTTITDSFTAADGTNLAGRTTDTGGKVWTALQGTFQILGNQAAPKSLVSNDLVVVDAGVADCTVSAVLSAAPNAGILAIRVTDVANHWQVYYTGTDLFLVLVTAGAPVTKGGITMAINAGDTVAAVCSGNTIAVKVNGTQVIAPVTNTANQTATKHGLAVRAGNAGLRWDAFSVTVP